MATAILGVGCTQEAHLSTPSTTSPEPPPARSRTSAPATSAVTHSVPLRADAARALETQAHSGDEANVKAALAVPPGQRIDPALVAGLAAMKSVKIDEARFKQLDDASATVPITTIDPTGKATTWTTTLILVDGVWRIGLTDPASG